MAKFKNMSIISHTILIVAFSAFVGRCNNDQSDYMPRKMQCDWAYSSFQSKQSQTNSQLISDYYQGQKGVFDMMNNNKGECILFFYDDQSFDSFSQSMVNALFIRLFDPKYIDGIVVQISISLGQTFNSKDNSWQGQQKITQYYVFNKMKLIYNLQSISNYNITNNHISFTDSHGKININFRKIQRSILLPIIFSIYSIILIIVSLWVSKANIICQKISLVSLYHAVTFMLFISIVQMICGVQQPLNSSTWLILSGLITSFLAVRIVKIFEGAAHRMIGIRPYLIFYICLFFYIWILINYNNSSWFIILNSLGLIPQIIHNIRYANKLGYHLSYIAIIVSNQLYVIYIISCPQNIFRLQPKPYLDKIIIIVTIIQIIIILCQNVYGPLFMIPKKCIRGYHNYEINIEIQAIDPDDQCPICLISLKKNPSSLHQILSDEVKYREAILTPPSEKISIMKTPCGHKFHPSCLRQWMEYKRQCPVDRTVIPPIM